MSYLIAFIALISNVLDGFEEGGNGTSGAATTLLFTGSPQLNGHQLHKVVHQHNSKKGHYPGVWKKAWVLVWKQAWQLVFSLVFSLGLLERSLTLPHDRQEQDRRFWVLRQHLWRRPRMPCTRLRGIRWWRRWIETALWYDVLGQVGNWGRMWEVLTASDAWWINWIEFWGDVRWGQVRCNRVCQIFNCYFCEQWQTV